ncbi:MAG: ribosome maturation factor RimM [Tunicatimonas sp.]
MRVADCYQLGYVIKTHGLHGEVSILLDVDFPDAYENLESVFVATSGSETLVPFFVERISVRQNKALVKFEEVDTIEQAEELLKAQLYLPLASLPALEGDQYYYHEIIGFTVTDKELGELGMVQDVYESTGQDMIVMQYQEKEVLIPINDDIVQRVNKTEKLVHITLPEGLLDVYLA